MWSDISFIWQTAFREAWEAFCAGSTPIGAVICDGGGNVILHDRNRNNEPQTLNRRMSHAETNILRQLDTRRYDAKSLTLYTTMEPCPMCMGTILMTNIKRVRYAAKDSYCGMVHLLKCEPYYSQKNVSCEFEGGEAEKFQITIQAYYELKHIEQGSSSAVFDKFSEHCPGASKAAKQLYAEKWLDKGAESKADISEVYDHVMNILDGMIDENA
ncbi:MAG: nucleoside deaminase [Oscillospiraceae bacterium]|nr:nucleoside deaminase [Oscillospiraceae bacterium]